MRSNCTAISIAAVAWLGVNSRFRLDACVRRMARFAAAVILVAAISGS
jgi:hypothetical protein